MKKQLMFTTPCTDSFLPRIGGEALIGNVIGWPAAPDGKPLTLILSLPTQFINEHTGLRLPENQFVSVYSYYSEKDYFLDMITYHGSEEEIEWLRKGFTRVILHKAGEAKTGPSTIPAMKLEVESDSPDNPAFGGGSHIGGQPKLLQSESLNLGDEQFTLQIYGGKFPKPFHGIFGLSDAVGYLYIDQNKALASKTCDIGTFFVQAT